MTTNTSFTKKREDSIYSILTGLGIYYGYEWKELKFGNILIDSGTEYWILKMKSSGSVRKLLHQNHGRSGKPVALFCSIQELAHSGDLMQQQFHDQKIDESDLRRVLRYIYNHQNARRQLDIQRQLFMKNSFA